LFAAVLIALFLLRTTVAQDDATEQPAYSDAEFYEPPTVRDAASDVLSSPEFRNLPRLDLGAAGAKAEPLKPKKDESKEDEVRIRTPSAGSDFLASLFGGAISLVVLVVLGVVLAAIIGLIVLGIKRWERSEKTEKETEADAATDEDAEPTMSPSEKPADAWLAAARQAAAAGRFDEAMALLLLGAMSHAERAGLIRPRRGLTYRDYLRAVPHDSAWRPALSELVRTYAPVGFGRREATHAAFEAVIGPYERALAVEPSPSALSRFPDDAVTS
jgi:hypothetical protein